MILYINTSEFNHIELAVVTEESFFKLSKDLAFNENYKALGVIQKFLNHNNISLQQLTKIIVCSGPGSFTGIRVGVALAQALGYALDINVQAIPKNKIPKALETIGSVSLPKKLSLNYGAKPNITKAKKKRAK